MKRERKAAAPIAEEGEEGRLLWRVERLFKEGKRLPAPEVIHEAAECRVGEVWLTISEPNADKMDPQPDPVLKLFNVHVKVTGNLVVVSGTENIGGEEGRISFTGTNYHQFIRLRPVNPTKLDVIQVKVKLPPKPRDPSFEKKTVRDALTELLAFRPEWTHDFTKTGRMYEKPASKLSKAEREELERDAEAPFFSEAYAYNLLGKEDARTVRALVKNVARAAGFSEGQIEQMEREGFLRGSR